MADGGVDQQQEELEGLRAIYAEDYEEIRSNNVWKGAAALPEIDIRLKHPNDDQISVKLRVKLPKTYPSKAAPVFNVHAAQGVTPDQARQLNEAIKGQIRLYYSKPMIFDICVYATEWITANITKLKEDTTPNISLAAQLKSRTAEAERVLADRQKQDKDRAEREESRQQAAMAEQISARKAQMLQANKDQQRTRRRGHSISTDATGMDSSEVVAFPVQIEVKGITFDSVRIACPRKEYLWTVHYAEPAHYSQHVNAPPLELYTIAFDAQYYLAAAGKKRMRELEESLRKVIGLPHKMLLRYYAVHLLQANRDAPPRLLILAEQRPSTTLHDLLHIAGPLNPPKATEFLVQIVSALNMLHAGDIIHRSVSAKCVHIDYDPSGPTSIIPRIKLARTSFFSRLCDLQHSNKFDSTPAEEVHIPESWIAREVKQQPLHYTRNRDLWNVGIVLLQMLYGIDVTSRHKTFTEVLDRTDFPAALRTVATAMFEPSKKRPWSCLRILDELQSVSVTLVTAPKSTPISIPSPRPRSARSQTTEFNSSPDVSTSPRAMINARRSELPPGRFMSDFTILDRLGSGGFGEVVKAEHKIDKKIYAIKKIKLRRGTDEADDGKIFREVNTLSRLNHRYIVRYFSAWIEDDEGNEIEPPSEDSSLSRPFFDSTIQLSSIGKSRGRNFPFNHASFSSLSESTSSDDSGPDIVFGNDSDDDGGGDEGHENGASGDETMDEEEDCDDELSLGITSPVAFRDFPSRAQRNARTKRPVANGPTQTLYISMEFVEKQTLKERIEEGLDEDEAWRLFNQVLDALVHMSNLGIIHRDIKLTNIFIDGKGDVKVGDFGLATSNLAQVAPNELTASNSGDPDITRDVGTRLYIAPEVISRSKKSRNQSKADMYSLGICFFEMNYMFSTVYERIQVIESLRKPDIIFPVEWPATHVRQRKIIEALLQHDPDKRMSSFELRHSDLLPPRLADEFFNESMRVMTRPDSSHYLQVVQALFRQPFNPVKAASYNSTSDRTAFEQVTNVVVEHLRRIFVKHGAVEMNAPLLGPVDPTQQQSNVAMFLDSSGDVVCLPRNLLPPFIRMSVARDQQRLKRFCIGDTYHQMGIGHPSTHKLAAFDILTPDMRDGYLAAVAEAIALVDECLTFFPGLGEVYSIDISHPNIETDIMSLFPEESRATVQGLLRRGPATEQFAAKKKRDLQRLGLHRAEAVVAAWHDRLRLEDLENNLPDEPRTLAITAAVEQVIKVMTFAKTLGVKRRLYFRTFTTPPSFYTGGISFQVSRGAKRSEEFAVGGRYDNLFGQIQPGRSLPNICGVGVQFSIQPLAAAVEAHLNAEKQAIAKKSRSSLGSWAPRRADVYVISRQPGHTQERLEICALLWQHNVRSDMMYDHAIMDNNSDDPLLLAQEDGIFFCVIVPPTLSASGRSEYKVKNLLSGEQHGLSRAELPVWLTKELAKQRREDQKTHDNLSVPVDGSTAHALDNIEYIMPDEFYSERKKFLKTNNISLMKVEELDREIRTAMTGHTPLVAVDVDSTVFSALTTNSNWLKDEDAWRSVLALFPKNRSQYAQNIRNQLRELPGYRKEINELILLCSARDLRVAVLRIPVSART
ncbi:kinase-like protein [Auriculariales sp. MPI-PUGE-AT-0066]|nr:kinase-like protein [Auriculariales sp. MPI-PUGE-AT-0066]